MPFPSCALRRLVRPGLAWSMAALCAACSTAPTPPAAVVQGDYATVAQYTQALIDHEMHTQGVTGLSIAIVDDQRVVWARGAGWADRAAQVPATEHTLYRMGSISKLLTDTAALQLAEQGRLALDEPIERALPGFAVRSRLGDPPITPRQLMTHHAGLPRDVLSGMWGMSGAGGPRFTQMVSGLPSTDADYPPGLLFSYSNLGVTVLGAAIEQVSSEPFESHMQRSVLQPLGMSGASFSAAVPALPAMSKAYDHGKLTDEPQLRDVPAGGLTASVLDMSRYLRMVFADGRSGEQVVLQPQQMAEMLRAQNDNVPLDVGFGVGLGWMLSTLGADPIVGGGPVIHHSGATINYCAQMYALPQHKLGVIVASNSAQTQQAVDTIAKRALALALEAKTGIRQPERLPGFVPARQPWADADTQAYLGEYATVAGYVRIVRSGGQLKAQAVGREFELLPGEGGRLGVRYAVLGLIPVSLGPLDQLEIQRRQINGRDVLVARLGGQDMLIGQRLPPPGGTVPRDLAGAYEPVLAPGEHRVLGAIELSVDGGRLMMQVQVNGETDDARIPLVLVSDTEARVLGPLADLGPTLRMQRDADGRVSLRYAGYTLRRRGE